MDDKVTAVLDAYHELIREQEQQRDQTPAADRHTGRDLAIAATSRLH